MDAGEGGAPKGKGFRSPIRLGEAVALIGVVIAGLGLYLTYSEHQHDKQDAAQAAQDARQQAQDRTILVLRGEGEGGQIRLVPANGDLVVQSQGFYFPSDVRGDVVHITGEGRIEARWFDAGLKQALHGAADSGAEHDLPVAIETSFLDHGETRTDRSLYEIGFTVHPRFLQGAVVRIEGLALSRRGLTGGSQAAANAAWASELPSKP